MPNDGLTLLRVLREAFLSLILPSKPIERPAQAVYARRISEGAGRSLIYITVAALVAIMSILISSISSSVRVIGPLLLTLIIPIAFLAWILSSDRYEPEPKGLVAAVFGSGMLAGLMIYLVSLYVVLPFLLEFLVALSVFLILYVMCRGETTGVEVNDHMDGLVYGTAAGVGLVTSLNASLFSLGTPPELTFFLATKIALSIVYALAAGIIGRWFGWLKAVEGRVSLIHSLPGLIIGVILLWIYSYGVGALSYLGFKEMLAGQAALLAVYSYIYVKYTREALRDEVSWGYARGLAPVEKP